MGDKPRIINFSANILSRIGERAVCAKCSRLYSNGEQVVSKSKGKSSRCYYCLSCAKKLCIIA